MTTTTACRWQTGTPRETTEDEPWRCTCCGEPMGWATAWPTCGACLQEGDEGEPIPSIPNDGLWPADQPTMWSAEPDEWSTPLAEGGA